MKCTQYETCASTLLNISVPSVVDVGYCLVGGCHVTQLVVKNEGGPGRFCIMPSSVWPTTNFKVIVLLSSWRLSCDTACSKE